MAQVYTRFYTAYYLKVYKIAQMFILLEQVQHAMQYERKIICCNAEHVCIHHVTGGGFQAS